MMTLIERMELYCRDADGNPMSGGEASGIDVDTLREAIDRIELLQEILRAMIEDSDDDIVYGQIHSEIMDRARRALEERK